MKIMSNSTTEIAGIILINKETGPSSHDIVNKVRKICQLKRVGHCGTLDPLATGLMIICVGRYTRLNKWLIGADKEYHTTFCFGANSTTDDSEGKITKIHNAPSITVDQLKEKTREFIGEISQVPPDYSAIHINGQRSYKTVRDGGKVSLNARLVTVKNIDLINFSYPHAEFKICCSKGTYVRSLARDIGRKCGSGAYVKSIHRTKIDHLHVDSALTLSQLKRSAHANRLDSCFVAPDRILKNLRHLHVHDSGTLKRFLQGNPIAFNAGEYVGECAVFNQIGQLQGIGLLTKQQLHPKTVMVSPN